MKNRLSNIYLTLVLSMLMMIGCVKNDIEIVPSSTSMLPELTIRSISDLEGNESNQFKFTVTLSEVSDKVVYVYYMTANETAVAGEDFENQEGLLSFPPGEKRQPILIAIKTDALKEADEEFSIQLTNSINATIIGGIAKGIILNDD